MKNKIQKTVLATVFMSLFMMTACDQNSNDATTTQDSQAWKSSSNAAVNRTPDAMDKGQDATRSTAPQASRRGQRRYNSDGSYRHSPNNGSSCGTSKGSCGGCGGCCGCSSGSCN